MKHLFHWNIAIVVCALFLSIQGVSSSGDTGNEIVAKKKYVIVKADDLLEANQKWKDFVNMTQSKGIKISIGVICESLSKDTNGYHQWIRQLNESGNVEFWNHGWDHKKWELNKKTVYEFSDSGFDHQQKHFELSESYFKSKLGFPLTAFGPPFSYMDQDTIKALKRRTDINTIFVSDSQVETFKVLEKTLLPTGIVKAETDGVGMPNFLKFKEDYEAKKNDHDFLVILFHPPWFKEGRLQEASNILDLLKSDGWTFILPREYALIEHQHTPSKPTSDR